MMPQSFHWWPLLGVNRIAAVKVALDWLETHGEEMELKEGVTPGKGLKRLCSCLATAIEQAQEPKTALPKPTKKKTP
jgi:hypothetical protein